MKTTVYALSTCPYCRMTREFLERKGVDFDVVEVDKLTGQEREDAIVEVQRISGGSSFPVIVCDSGHVVGYDHVRLKELLGL